MSARDELARDVFLADNVNAPDGLMEAEWDGNEGDETYAHMIADGLIARGYSKPRTITTAEELDALAIGSVIRTAGVEDVCDPRIAVKAAFWHNESEWFTADDSEWCLSSDELDDLPATVLYEP